MMKSSAILFGLLIVVISVTGCERTLEDPWTGLYGEYLGFSEMYKPAPPESDDQSVHSWIRMGELAADTISILDVQSSIEGIGYRALVKWNGSCRLLEDCGYSFGQIYELDFSDYLGEADAFKSSPSIMYIPRGAVYPKSDFQLEELADQISGQQIIGLETFDEGGLYFFDLRTDPSGSAVLLLFTGTKTEEPGSSGTWRKVKLWGQEKNSPEYVAPAS